MPRLVEEDNTQKDAQQRPRLMSLVSIWEKSGQAEEGTTSCLDPGQW